MNTIELNCDMGEGMGNEEAIMPFIHSANISCGFHAGTSALISHTIGLALKNKVHIGAHPSFRDKFNFGRKEIILPADKIYAIVLEQLIRIDLLAKEKGASLHHVKPHGALYNMGAKDPKVAAAIAQAVMDFDENLILYGLSGSCLISEAGKLGLKTKSEVFADRTYQDDGTLTPRSKPGARIEDPNKCLQQVKQMILYGTVTTVNGNTIPVLAETICIHGDEVSAPALAEKIHRVLQQQAIAS